MTSNIDDCLLTLEHAMFKWCPEARAPSTNGDKGVAPTTVNRRASSMSNENSMCLGDECMFWRWHDKTDREAPHPHGSRCDGVLGNVPSQLSKTGHWAVWDAEADHGDGEGWFDTVEIAREMLKENGVEDLDTYDVAFVWDEPRLEPRGYCGKAGHPYAVDLIEAQLELLRLQLYDHRNAA